jgi:hypothetical protein
MTDRTSVHGAAKQASDERNSYTYLDSGWVTSAAETARGPPAVYVQSISVPNDRPVPVAPAVHGDYYVPPEGSPVLVGYRQENDPVVIASGVPNTRTPAVSPGERVLSHPLSDTNVLFTNDGSLHIVQNDGPSIKLQSNNETEISSSTITIDANNIQIADNTNVGGAILNMYGGTKGSVKDVTISDTNSNGGATALNIERQPFFRI